MKTFKNKLIAVLILLFGVYCARYQNDNFVIWLLRFSAFLAPSIMLWSLKDSIFIYDHINRR